jgi:hypothetical protein
MADFAFGRFSPVFDLSEKRWLDLDAAVGDFLGVGLRFSDQRL